MVITIDLENIDIENCQLCDKELGGDVNFTICCGFLCNECFEPTISYTDFSGRRSLKEGDKHQHEWCQTCDSAGFNSNVYDENGNPFEDCHICRAK